MEPTTFETHRLVKSEDLNHHRTLFAGRCAEWFVEAGFIAAASVLPPNEIVCLKIHGLEFTQPVQPGEIACFRSKLVHAGRTSLIVYITLSTPNHESPIVQGFITFVRVDEKGKSQPHNLTLTFSDPEDIRLNEEAGKLQ
jgi:acyl-CoA hydrolase